MRTDERHAPAANARDGPHGDAAAVSAEYALLGLILLAGGQSHGYALTRQFAHGEFLATNLGLEPALVYYYLKKLARRGWVSQARADQPPRPPRQLCQITTPGREAFWAWSSMPCSAPELAWPEFLLKLYLVERLEPARAVLLVSEQYAACRHCHAALSDEVRPDRTLTSGRQAAPGEPFTRRASHLRLLAAAGLHGLAGRDGWRMRRASRRGTAMNPVRAHRAPAALFVVTSMVDDWAGKGRRSCSGRSGSALGGGCPGRYPPSSPMSASWILPRASALAEPSTASSPKRRRRSWATFSCETRWPGAR